MNAIRGVAAIALVALAVAAGCSGGDKAGGSGGIVTLRLATDDDPEATASQQIKEFARQVRRLSDGRLRIHVGWSANGTDSEAPSRLRSGDREEGDRRKVRARARSGACVGRLRRDQPAGDPGAVPREQRRAARQGHVRSGRRDDALGTRRRRRGGPRTLARGAAPSRRLRASAPLPLRLRREGDPRNTVEAHVGDPARARRAAARLLRQPDGTGDRSRAAQWRRIRDRTGAPRKPGAARDRDRERHPLPPGEHDRREPGGVRAADRRSARDAAQGRRGDAPPCGRVTADRCGGSALGVRRRDPARRRERRRHPRARPGHPAGGRPARARRPDEEGDPADRGAARDSFGLAAGDRSVRTSERRRGAGQGRRTTGHAAARRRLPKLDLAQRVHPGGTRRLHRAEQQRAVHPDAARRPRQLDDTEENRTCARAGTSFPRARFAS